MIMRHAVATTAAVLALGALSLSAQAASQFASYNNAGQFTFVNSGSNHSLVSGTGPTDTPIGVDFYLTGSSTAIKGLLDFSATEASVTGSAGSYRDLLTLTKFSIKELSNPTVNLLTVVPGSPTPQLLFAQTGSKAGSLQFVPNAKFSFTSDVFHFTSSAGETATLTMSFGSNLSTSGSYFAPLSGNGSSGVFTASGSPVPEASTLIGFGGLLAGSSLVCLRRRRLR